MSIFDRGLRGNVQSPFSSSNDASSTAYTNPRLIGNWNGNVQLAIDFLLDAVYPNYKGTVATHADLPGTATANDFYIVVDDGDGKSAGYVYSVIQGVTSWIKRYDVDWSYEQILADTVNRTSFMYAAKYGATDKDASGTAITGTYAGQRVYGGDTTLENYTLTANAVDSTGFVQTDNTFRPTSNNALDLGTTALKWRTAYLGTSAIVGTTTYGSGSLSDTSFSFGTTNLTGTGTLATGQHTVSTTLVLGAGNIHDTSGALSFSANNLSTTGTVTAATGSVLADITFTAGTFNTASAAFSFSSKNVGTIGTLSATTVTATTVNAGNLTAASQTLTTTSGALILQSVAGGNATTVQINSKAQLNNDLAVTGVSGMTGAVTVGTALKLQTSSSNANISSLLGDIQLVPTSGIVSVTGKIAPEADATRDLGTTALRFANLYLGTAIGDGTNTISMATLMSLRGINTGVGTGNVLAWNGTAWAPESTSGVIDHTTLTNLTASDAGHTQFPLLTGRTGGQTIQGGTAASQNLTLDSTSNATKGFVLVSSVLAPTTDASFSAGWTGTDLGGSSRNFKDIYTKGIHFGLRLDQYAGSGAYPTNSGQNVGRIIWDTVLNKMLVDNGTTWSSTGTVTSVAMTVPSFLSITGSPITTSGTLAVTLSGTALPIANGGTAVTSVTTAPAASSFAGWDANKNLTANNHIEAYTTTATAAGTTTLVVGSTYLQYFTGSTTQTVLMPVASTLVLGQQFRITNLSSGSVTVQSSGANNIQVMVANTQLVLTCILASGTTAASWSAQYAFISGTNGTVTSVAMSVPAFLSIAGTPITASGTLAVTLSGTALPIANGGTAVTSVTTAPAASAFAGWDANKNLSANNLLGGYTTTATAAGTTTLVVGSTSQQYFTGVTTQTVVLPVASTLVNGLAFTITNTSSGIVTVQTSGANAVQAMAANTQLVVTCINTAGGTGTASWQWVYGQIASGLPLSNPMTTAGDLIYGGSSGAATRLANGTAGNFLKSAGGTAAPTWAAFVAPTRSIVTPTSHTGGFSANATGNYTTPANVIAIRVRVQGAGGGGGGVATAASSTAAAPGGGGGGYCEAWLFPTALQVYTFTVASGGAGGAAGANAGAAATPTTFGTTLLTANGGGGGAAGPATTTFPSINAGIGAAGGGASGGDLNVTGGAGGVGLVLSVTSSVGGAGGNSVLGTGAIAQTPNTAGQPGNIYGGGGGGATNVSNGGALAGGNGASGVIIVEEFYQ